MTSSVFNDGFRELCALCDGEDDGNNSISSSSSSSSSSSEQQQQQQQPQQQNPRLLHGRHSVYDDSNNNKLVFTGRFVNGVRCGRGTQYFPDGSSLTGVWMDDDRVHGYAVYTSGDGATISGTYTDDGVLQGRVVERKADGSLIYEGEYAENCRHGMGKCILADGSMYVGEFRAGALNGECEFVYQPHDVYSDTRLVGEWRDGNMLSAGGYTYEPSCRHRLCSASGLLLADVYEQQTVIVKLSTIANAGEGLFARRRISVNTICAYYNGIHVTQEEVDARPWSLCDNTITLKAGWCLDVPPAYASTKQYCATLGHKANHRPSGSAANAKYVECEHPRFGHIMSVRSTRLIEVGEEIFVDYEYAHNDRPQWYYESD